MISYVYVFVVLLHTQTQKSVLKFNFDNDLKNICETSVELRTNVELRCL